MSGLDGELAQLIRRIVREEIAKTSAADDAPDPKADAELEQRVLDSAAKMRRARGGR